NVPASLQVFLGAGTKKRVRIHGHLQILFAVTRLWISLRIREHVEAVAAAANSRNDAEEVDDVQFNQVGYESVGSICSAPTCKVVANMDQREVMEYFAFPDVGVPICENGYNPFPGIHPAPAIRLRSVDALPESRS